jgi:hypothetical protein
MAKNDDTGGTPFDKFMDAIIEKESMARGPQGRPVEETPQRKYNRLYREIPHNRIRLVKNDNTKR